MKPQKKHVLPCILLFCLFLCLSLFVSACGVGQPPPAAFSSIPDSAASAIETEKAQESQSLSPSWNSATPLKVHFLDVGQGDSAFLQLPGGETLLIDAGNPGDGPRIVHYIRSLGVTHINYIIATHPHADHIGGMAEVIDNFSVGEIYMPKVTHTSRTYEMLLQTIRDKQLKIHNGTAGTVIYDQEECHAEILSPADPALSDDLNDASIVCKVQYGATSFLFTGDISAAAESWISDPACTVLKVAHHGSSGSSSAAFLDKASPKYAVISVGLENSYGHPAEDTLNRLKETGAEIFLTSQQGTIVFESSGDSVWLSASKRPGPSCTPEFSPAPHPQMEPAGRKFPRKAWFILRKPGKNIIVPPALISRAARSLWSCQLQGRRIFSRAADVIQVIHLL